MMKIPVRDMSGGSAGDYEFDAAELAPGDINRQLLHDAVVMYEANRRVGTVQTKSRGMVRGSTKKLFRQKGTGRARAGNARTPVRRGGGHAFGKKNRDFSYRLPRKAIRLATRMALLSKFQDEQAVLVSELACAAPKTKVIAEMLTKLSVSGSVLLVSAGLDKILYQSARNIPGVAVLPVSDLNAYDLLKHRNLVMASGAMDVVLGRGESAVVA
ncbi:MAG: 50S ribosomal protein L4 [Fuerstiella sp.]